MQPTVRPSVRWTVMIESKSGKTRISAPSHPSATGGRVSGLVFLPLSFLFYFLVAVRLLLTWFVTHSFLHASFIHSLDHSVIPSLVPLKCCEIDFLWIFRDFTSEFLSNVSIEKKSPNVSKTQWKFVCRFFLFMCVFVPLNTDEGPRSQHRF